MGRIRKRGRDLSRGWKIELKASIVTDSLAGPTGESFVIRDGWDVCVSESTSPSGGTQALL